MPDTHSRSSVSESLDGASNSRSVLQDDPYILTLLLRQCARQAIDQNVAKLMDARQRISQIVGEPGVEVVPFRGFAYSCLYL